MSRRVKFLLEELTNLSKSGYFIPQGFIFLFNFNFNDSYRFGQSLNFLLALFVFCLQINDFFL
jgi:hypothetical protein